MNGILSLTRKHNTWAVHTNALIIFTAPRSSTRFTDYKYCVVVVHEGAAPKKETRLGEKREG